MLRCSNLTLTVEERVLCTRLNVCFAPGEVWAVLGRNGCGKSTLVNALAGLSRAAAGRIELDDLPITDWDARLRAHRVGVLLQMEEGTFFGTVTEYVLLGRFPYTGRWSGYSDDDLNEARDALVAAGASALGSRRFETLSGGERQRVRVAQLLAQQPRILLLDEPLQHLDLAHQSQVLTLVGTRARAGATAVMVLHDLSWLDAVCTHAVIFYGDGEVEAGRAEEVLTRERLERAYGCALSEARHSRGRAFIPKV